MIPKVAVAVNAAAFALLAYLYGVDIADATRAATAEVAALSALPNVPYAVLVLVLAGAGIALTALGVARARDRSWRGYRVMPLVLVIGLFVDLFVLSAGKTPFPSMARAQAALEVFDHKVSEISPGSEVTTDRVLLEKIVADLGEAPWLQRGQQLKAWVLQLETGCSGPRLERGSAAAGTIFYCVSADRKRAWVTAVGLPAEVRFGPAAVLSMKGQPVVRVVSGPNEDEPGQAVPEDGELPLMFEADAGNLGPLP